MFGLINANARLYSPYLGRFVSPDPLLNSEGSAWDYNPYVYANNNPYRFIDRNGEFAWMAIFAAFNAIWNTVNTVRNIKNIIHNGWDGLFFGAVDAVAGAFGGWAGPAFASVVGLETSSAISGAVSGAVSGLVSSTTEGLLNALYTQDWSNFSFTNCLMQTASSAVLGGIIGGLDAVHDGRSFWHGYEKGPTVCYKTGHPDVKQSTGANCCCACGQSVTDGRISQDQLRQVNNDARKIKGLETVDPNKVGTPDLGTYKVAAAKIGKEAEYVNYSPRKMFKRMMMGEDFGITYDVAGLNRAGEYSVGDHNVLMKGMLGPTWRKPNGSLIIRKPTNMWVMDPALGGVREITKSQLQSIIRVYK